MTITRGGAAKAPRSGAPEGSGEADAGDASMVPPKATTSRTRRTHVPGAGSEHAAAVEKAQREMLREGASTVSVPIDATAAEKAQFERGEGGELSPVVCVDKRPEDVGSFAALLEESSHTGASWDILFVAAMNGRGGHAPNADEAVQPLKMMVEAIKSGRVGQFLAVDRDGLLVELSRE